MPNSNYQQSVYLRNPTIKSYPISNSRTYYGSDHYSNQVTSKAVGLKEKPNWIDKYLD